MRKVLAIGFLLGALIGGGCGDDDEPQSGGGQEPKQEGAVDGTGYSFVPPEGWNDAADAFQGSAVKIDKAYAEPNPEQGFANNVNIIRETPQGLDADRFDEYIVEFRRQAESQVVAIHGDGLYTITWTARKNAFEDSKTEFEGLLDSWRWSGG